MAFDQPTDCQLMHFQSTKCIIWKRATHRIYIRITPRTNRSGLESVGPASGRLGVRITAATDLSRKNR